MSEHGGVHSCEESPSCECHIQVSNPSVHQTLDELDFEKGIWTSALTGDNVDVEQKLASSGGSVVNKADKSGFTALHYACRNGHIQVCHTLLDHHADVNVATKSSRATPLHRAAYMGHANIVSLLLQHGADPMAVDCDGMTPLHKAAENGHTDTVDILMSSEPKASGVTDFKGRKPIDVVKNEEARCKLQPCD